MSEARENFVSRVDSEILAQLQALAEREGCPLQSFIDEALADLLEKRKRPRAHVMDAYLASHEKYAPLYKKLAQ